ncbi:MAG: hypothetical protein KOO60_12635 [Gemmatimonadales bacterium]|nr:hypothetical protein [Gemmatimonadales bacterium]
MIKALGLVLPLLTILALGSCKPGEISDELARFTDEDSLARLAEVPVESMILLSLLGHQAMGDLPDLGEGGRKLSSFGKSYLVEVPWEVLPDLAATPGLNSVVIWGNSDLATKMDARLRLTMLSRVSGPELRETPLAVVARFSGDVLDLRHSLEKLGAAPRSVNAGVVTMDATVDVLLEILARSDLVSLAKPIQHMPLRSE